MALKQQVERGSGKQETRRGITLHIYEAGDGAQDWIR